MDNTKISEYKMRDSFHNKRFGDLTDRQKELIRRFHPTISDDQILNCDLCNRYSKPDIYVSVGSSMTYLSLKDGRSDSLHFESVKGIVLFLRWLGVSAKTQKTILLFHYGDGTLDGSGQKRILFEDLLPKLSSRLKEANEELGQRNIVDACLERFMFSGTENRRQGIDAVVFGSPDCPVYATKDEIRDAVLNRHFRHIRTLHIGPMTLQPYLRDVNRKSKHPEKREVVQVKWHYLLTDIEKIEAARNHG